MSVRRSRNMASRGGSAIHSNAETARRKPAVTGPPVKRKKASDAAPKAVVPCALGRMRSQTAKDAGSEMVDESTGAGLKRRREINPAQPSLLEHQGKLTAGAGDQDACQGRKPGLMAHQQDRRSRRHLTEVLDEFRGSGAGCQGGDVPNRRTGPELRDDNPGGLPAPRQRAAQDPVEGEPQNSHSLCAATHFLLSLGRERTIPIVAISHGAVRRGDGVAQQVDLQG